MSQNCQCLLAGNQEVRFEGNLEASIIFVFESPGQTELNEYRPVCGPAGVRWETELNKVGISRQEVFIINSARCRINKQAFSDSQIKQIVKSCRPALKTAIEHIKPKVIVVCGGVASHSVMDVPITGIKKRRGTWDYSKEFDCLVLYTIHPSATLRNESDLPLFQQDLRSLQTFVNNGYSNPTEETNYQEVDSIKFMLDKSNITVGLDTETQGLKWFDENFVLISYSVSDAPRTGYNIVLWEEVRPAEGSDEIPEHDKYIVWHRDKEDVPVFLKKADFYDTKMNELRELLIREDIKKYTKNGIGYDCHVFEAAGLPRMVNHAMDVQLASHALDSELYLNNNLEFLTKSFTNMAAFKTEFKAAYKIEDMLWTLRENREAYNLYAIQDADATRRIGIAIREEMIKDPTTANYYMKLVHPVAETVLYNISKNGMLADKDGIKKAEVEVLDELDICEKECIKRIPPAVKAKHVGNLNLNRRKLIADTLFTEDGFGLVAKSFTTKTGDPQVGKDILKQLKLHAKKDARDFLEWRENREELRILYSNYIKSLQEYIGADNRIRTSMSVSFTSSGRVGARKPNTMVFPARNKKQKRIVKSLFIAPPGYKLINLDQSQSELRFLAFIAQDNRLLEAFRNDEDIHSITAIGMVARAGEIWGNLDTSKQKEARQKAKPVNFGLPFGMSSYGLMEYALNDYGIKLSKKEAKEMWEGWHNLYPGVRLWHEECLAKMYRDGKVRTIFGRNRYLRNLTATEERIVKEAERTGINVLIQGPSSDYTLLGGRQMYKDGFVDTEDIKLVNFVHDSLAFYVKEEKVEELAPQLKQRMEHVDTSDFGFELSVPMKVDIQVGDNLAEMEELEL